MKLQLLKLNCISEMESNSHLGTSREFELQNSQPALLLRAAIILLTEDGAKNFSPSRLFPYTSHRGIPAKATLDDQMPSGPMPHAGEFEPMRSGCSPEKSAGVSKQKTNREFRTFHNVGGPASPRPQKQRPDDNARQLAWSRRA